MTSSQGREVYGQATVGPNTVALLRDGFQAYPAMLDALAQAQHTVCLETYILKDDATGMRFVNALMEKARAGVEVLLMYDAWGSEVRTETVSALHDAGVKLHVFRPWKYMGKFRRALAYLSRRNHRKTLIVDGRIAFTGGLNISDDYAAREDGGANWRDTHLCIEGPQARAVEALFLSTWASNKAPPYERQRFHHQALKPCDTLHIVGNDFAKDRKGIRRAYERAFARAQTRILLTNAYFLPPARLIKILVSARRRGVTVSVILAGTTDVKAVLYAARGLYPRLLKHGIEVYEWANTRVLHAKTAVVDGVWSTVGSSNLDPLSLRNNLEVNAIIVDATLGMAMERLFREDLQHCRRITMDEVKSYGLLHRLLSALAFRLRHWL